jgi:hypothetical protein
MNLGGGRAGGGVIWVHAGISLLAFLLVVYKLGSAGFSLGRLRHGLKSERIAELLSLLLAAVMIPLLATGIALLIAPSKGSFAAYSHLVASAWWTGLLLWHLRRYLAAAVREVLRPSAFPAAAD